MKEMVKNFKVSFRWWRGGLDNKQEINPGHVGALEESAWNRIMEMQSNGFTSGELHDTFGVLGVSGDDVEYSGHWEIKEE